MKAWILLYHALDSAAEPATDTTPAGLSLTVPESRFREQLEAIARLGKRIVSLDRLLCETGDSGRGESVILTFDDGHRSNWSIAMPALVNAGATATFYVVAGFVDAVAEYMTSAQLRDLAAAGMLIGSHTMTHPFLPHLSRLETRNELADSRARLEDILGSPVLDFAIPGGHCNRVVLEEARRCGYRSIATCKVGVYRTSGDAFRLPRLEVRRGLTLRGFERTFDRTTLAQLQMLELGKASMRKACGLSNYEKLRGLAHRYLALSR